MQDIVKAIEEIITREIGKQIDSLRKEFNVKFDQINARFDRLESKIDSLEERVTSLEKKVASLEKRVASLEKKVTSLEARVVCLEAKISDLETKIIGLDSRTTTLEADVKNIKHILSKHDKKIDAIFDIVCLDKEVNAPKFEKINEISEKVHEHQLHILNLENKISILEKNIS